jgi:hypothetical protein
MVLSPARVSAHQVPACCIGPETTDPDFAHLECPIPPTQAPNSQGGDTVRVKNKHCDFEATHGGPNTGGPLNGEDTAGSQ